MTNYITDLEGATAPRPFEAELEKDPKQVFPRISTDSTQSTTSNDLVNIGKLSLSSEGTNTDVVLPKHRM